jgi:hypothetical protein
MSLESLDHSISILCSVVSTQSKLKFTYLLSIMRDRVVFSVVFSVALNVSKLISVGNS